MPKKWLNIRTENQDVFQRPKERSRCLETTDARAHLEIASAVLQLAKLAKQSSKGQQVRLDRADSHGSDTHKQSLN